MAKLELNDLALVCPECKSEIDVPISVEVSPESLRDGKEFISLKLTPDLTEVWAHAWSHTENGEKE